MVMLFRKIGRKRYEKLSNKGKLRNNLIGLFISSLIILLGYFFMNTGSALLGLFICFIGGLFFLCAIIPAMINLFKLLKENKIQNVDEASS